MRTWATGAAPRAVAPATRLAQSPAAHLTRVFAGHHDERQAA